MLTDRMRKVQESCGAQKVTCHACKCCYYYYYYYIALCIAYTPYKVTKPSGLGDFYATRPGNGCVWYAGYNIPQSVVRLAELGATW